MNDCLISSTGGEPRLCVAFLAGRNDRASKRPACRLYRMQAGVRTGWTSRGMTGKQVAT
jgi:hypothetical protein